VRIYDLLKALQIIMIRIANLEKVDLYCPAKEPPGKMGIEKKVALF
jgi:hypothetical protein